MAYFLKSQVYCSIFFNIFSNIRWLSISTIDANTQ